MGLAGLKGLQGLQGLIAGLSPFDFDLALATFTARMDKRAAPGPFATAPIVQGKFDGSGVPDALSMVRGVQINGDFYANYDGAQGSVVLWWTPEKDRDGGQIDDEYLFQLATVNATFLRYEHDDEVFHVEVGGQNYDVPYTTVAGTMYCIVLSWDSNNEIDGTNYSRFSINNVHTFGATSFAASTPAETMSIGSWAWLNGRPANGIIEGFTIYRRPLFDGTYGVDVGNGDEIELIHAAGAGADPCLITGSWDVVFCLPTNSTAEELVTGTGEAWSHPHSSEAVEHAFLEDGGYLGDEYAVLGNGSTTEINFGSDITLDDIPAAAQMTVEFWARISPNVGTWLILLWKSTTGVGWRIGINDANNIYMLVDTNGTTGSVQTQADTWTDGKWHHFAFTYDDTVGRTPIIWIDGKLEPVWDTAATGVYASDVGQDLKAFSAGFIDTIGWIRISDNIRYAAEFVPSRQMPGADGNTIEQWAMNEGTGVNVAATVTTPGNDGTLANGTWEEQWDQEGTPVIPYTVEFDALNTAIDCGSDASIDNLADNAFTVEAWVNSEGIGEGSYSRIFDKSAVGGGWFFTFWAAGNVIRANIKCANSPAETNVATPIIHDKRWHHVLMTFDDAGDRKIYLAVDGVWFSSYDAQDAGVGAVDADAAQDLFMGNRSAIDRTFRGKIGWGRISNIIRWTPGTNFVPPSRLNPPGVDGNTVAQWNFRDGAGATLLDETVNNNDGTIIDGVWRITPDVEIDSPGQRVYKWGYVIGNDAANEGFYQQQSGLDAGENYVARLPISYEGVRAQPQIIAYDATNSAPISTFLGPKLHGSHSGGNNSPTLICAGGEFPQSLFGAEIYNITDGSHGTIILISGDKTTITAALSGGVEDDWDTNDVFMIMVDDEWVWCEPFCFELPTIARNGAAADCVELHFKCTNLMAEGVLYWEQVELLAMIHVDNPSVETGAGNPWIPDGWTNAGLAAGDSQAEGVIVHSGVGSMRFNVGAAWESVRAGGTNPTVGKFYGCGLWSLCDGVQTLQAARPTPHSLAASVYIDTPSSQVWSQTPWVGKALDTLHIVRASGGAGGPRYLDDYYIYQLDDVSLTVTPANQVNSMEGVGIRVDGRDGLPQPIPAGSLYATEGWVRWRMTPRHSNGVLESFGITNPVIAHFRFNVNNRFSVTITTDINIVFSFDVAGILTQGAWTPTNLVAGVEQLWEIRYNATQAELIVNGVTVITIIPGAGIDFGANIPNWAYWGTLDTSVRQGDAVFAAP